jgi:hypothetical protein
MPSASGAGSLMRGVRLKRVHDKRETSFLVRGLGSSEAG